MKQNRRRGRPRGHQHDATVALRLPKPALDAIRELARRSKQSVPAILRSGLIASLTRAIEPAVAVAKNAVLVAGTNRRFATPEAEPEETYAITALDLKSRKSLWQHPLPAASVAWGIAVDRAGRVLVALQDGSLLCFASEG